MLTLCCMAIRRSIIRAAAVAAIPLGLLTFSVPPAAGLPPTTWTKWYYSDPDFQHWVGEKSLFCNGSTYTEGTLSGHSLTVVTEPCSTGSPVGPREFSCFVWWPPNGPFTTVPCH